MSISKLGQEKCKNSIYVYVHKGVKNKGEVPRVIKFAWCEMYHYDLQLVRVWRSNYIRWKAVKRLAQSFVFLLFSQNSIVGHNPVWFYSGNLFVKTRPVYKYFNAEQGKHWIFIRCKYWIEKNVLNVFFVNFVIRAPGLNLSISQGLKNFWNRSRNSKVLGLLV